MASNHLSQWKSLMNSWPTDGWAGAAGARSAHARSIREIEAKMDADDPNWRDGDLGVHRSVTGNDFPNVPRTQDPRHA